MKAEQIELFSLLCFRPESAKEIIESVCIKNSYICSMF